MRVFGIAGWSGSGKTTLLRRLLPELTSRGLEVATMKYTHHQFDLFAPGHVVSAWRDAGANEVLYVSDPRWALVHELQGEPEPFKCDNKTATVFSFFFAGISCSANPQSLSFKLRGVVG